MQPDNAEPLSLAEEEQIDAKCMRFEQGWKAGRPATLEELLHGIGDSLRAPLLRELLRVEIHHRRLKGETPAAEEYVPRFPGMEAMVRSLLPPGEVAATLQTGVERIGGSIGPYKLLQKLGEGGMGVVYVAEQEYPVRRKVALKIIKPGMDTAQVVARFEVERQALAMMDHPNIAKVFDGGQIGEPSRVSDRVMPPIGTRELTLLGSPRPYFVMELVKGVAITQYCDDNKLSPRERLELFLPVCQAIQHAHQKGIIHRDIKPTNVLISLHDGRPSPKVIDFGIAKAINQQLTERTLHTQAGQIVGTLEYMSPEQAELTGLDIDTRSDIYSLGVLLYELLTGDTPFERQRFRKASLTEMLRIIREEEPPRPSMRLSGLRIAERKRYFRIFNPQSAIRNPQLQELDWIVMKTLEKDRTRRYETASALARDIQRYLEQEPIEACPPTARYRLRKFAHKHRKALMLGTTFLVLLVAGVAGSTWQAIRATLAEREWRSALTRAEEAEKEASGQRDDAVEAQKQAADEAAVAQAVSQFLREDLLDQAGARGQAAQQRVADPKLQVRTVLDRAAAKIAGRFDKQPLVEAAIRLTIGNSYHDLGLYREAVPHLERAHELYRRQLGVENRLTLQAGNDLAFVYQAAGKYDEAERHNVQTLAVRRKVMGEKHPDTLTSRHNLALVWQAQGKFDKAEDLLTEVWRAYQVAHGKDQRATLICANNLALLYMLQGKHDEAEKLAEATLKTGEAVLGKAHPDVFVWMVTLADAYRMQRKHDKAQALMEEALATGKKVLGKDHPSLLYVLNNQAQVYLARNRPDLAEPLALQAFERGKRILGERHPDVLIWMANLAKMYGDTRQFDKAEPLALETYQAFGKVMGENHRNTLTMGYYLAQIYANGEKLDKAESLAEKVYETGVSALGDDSGDVMVWRYYLATICAKRKNYARAEPLLARSVAVFRVRLPNDHQQIALTLMVLGLVRLEQKRYDTAEVPLRESLEIRRKQIPDWQTFSTKSMLGASLLGQKKFTDAEPLLLDGYKGMKARVKTNPQGTPRLLQTGEWIVQLYEAWNKPDKAKEWREKLKE